MNTNSRQMAGLLLLSISPTLTSCIATKNSFGDAEPVTVCQVLAEPKRYDHKVLRISGMMSHGFEGFVLSDSGCPEAIWLEYGGRMGSGTLFAGEPSSERARAQSLVIEGVPTSIVYDYEFRKLDGLIRSKRTIHGSVSIEGRYFSGALIETRTAPFYGGYGHLGMFSLLVIQKVINFRSD